MPVAPQTLPASRTAAMTPGVVVVVLSLMLGIQPITTDLYLPSLPALTDSFGASVSQAQLTLTTLLLAFGTSQLVWGPLSDRFGRRPVLIAGLSAYTLASVGCALAPSMTALILWRTLQGAAMGAAVMGARAIIRDLYSPEIGARVMANAMGGLGVIACLSPPLGGLIGETLGWRWALAGLVLFGAAAVTLIALRFQETVSQRNPRALQPRILVGNWLAIVRNPTFLAYTALSTCAYAGLFTFLASSSFVFIKVLGLTRVQYGVLVFSMSFTYLLGTLVCRRMLPRLGLRRSLAIAGGCSLAGGTLLGLLGLAGVRQPVLLILPYYLFILAHGIHQPCAQSGAVGPFPQMAGAASALNGFISMVVAFGVGLWVGQRLDGTVFALTNGVWFWSVCLATVAWTLVQKHGDPRRA
jgi:DHA1 family bicyclomycin/chloramphenicol resistance-like MFS transporter